MEQVRQLAKRDAREVADLHAQGIRSGFLTKLGRGFLRELYIGICSSPSGFGYVWEDGGGRVLGFISCAEDSGRLFKQVLLRRGMFMAVPLLRFTLSPATIRRMWQTLRYPTQTQEADLPAAEVLSIVVGDTARGRGTGKDLMAAALTEFVRRGISEVKVAVSLENSVAKGFYERCGFELTLTRTHHGRPMDIYVLRT